MPLTNWKALAFIILTIVIDAFVDTAWVQYNSHTDFTGWAVATQVAYLHFIPLGASAAISGAIFGSASRKRR